MQLGRSRSTPNRLSSGESSPGFSLLLSPPLWGSGYGEPFPKISVIGLAAALLGGSPIFKEAIQDIWERRMTMELSMTIALVAALLIGEFFTLSCRTSMAP